MSKKVVIVSGYFNPVHKGHIEYFNNARSCGDELCVIVNSDLQRELKGSKEFMKQEERLFIVENLRMVDHTVMSVDQDRTVRETIRLIHDSFKSKDNEIVLAFANGGDQNNDTIPERPVCEELGVELIDDMGDKIQSSSWLLNNQ